MNLTSPAFDLGQPIPTKYTCDGENINPPLSIFEVLETAKSLGLIMDDPDAPNGTFTHWLIWNFPAETTKIEEQVADPNAIAGTNSFNTVGYRGPCPPAGEEHRYFFYLYALDITLDLDVGSTREQLEKAMQGHIIADCKLMGAYKRKA